MKKFKIGGVPEHFNAPWVYALQQGWFKNANLDIEFIYYSAGTGAMCEALQSGELDLAVLLTEGAVLHSKRGASDIIAPYVNSPLIWGIHVAATSSVDKIHKLKNPVFAISRYGSGSHLMTYFLAQQQGWDKHSLTFIEKGNLDNLCDAILNHDAQAFLWEVFTTKIKITHGELKCIGTLPTPWPAFMLVARKDIKEKFSAKLKTILKIIYRATKFFNENHQHINHFIQQNYHLALVDVNSWLKTVEWAIDTTIPEEQLRQAENLFR